MDCAEEIRPEDRVLDWKPGHDERSRNYSMADRASVADKIRVWSPGRVLDQGREGACVGFGWTAELLASPYPFRSDYNTAQAFAQYVYNRARAFDRAKGYNWAEGASVTAGAQSVIERGHIGQYRWAFNIDQLRGAVITEGPAVIGIPWYSGMYRTRESGLLEVSGSKVGGHCLLLHGFHPNMRIAKESWTKRFRVFYGINSWGPTYGNNGVFYIREDDLAALLRDNGEACIPMRRRKISRL